MTSEKREAIIAVIKQFERTVYGGMEGDYIEREYGLGCVLAHAIKSGVQRHDIEAYMDRETVKDLLWRVSPAGLADSPPDEFDYAGSREIETINEIVAEDE